MDGHPAPQDHRLFFALWPPDAVRGQLEQAVDTAPVLHHAGRRVPAAKYHLTLHFLGGWPEWPCTIADAARRAATGTDAPSFDLRIDRIGGFRGSRVGYLAPAPEPALAGLWSALDAALAAHGVPRRAHARFTPHVTVSRNVRQAPDESLAEPVRWPVEDFVLVHSRAGLYDIVDRWPLRR